MRVVGDVEGQSAIIVDDIVDTAGTLAAAAAALREAGASDVRAYCTHAVLSGRAIERIEESVLKEVVVTNSIPMRDAGRACSRLRVLSIARLIGEAIRRTHREESVSSLFV
jgi:ribose-phosphate pyrophosphokinase